MSRIGGFLGGASQSIIGTPSFTDTKIQAPANLNNQSDAKQYDGGTVTVGVSAADTQESVARRALLAHAKAAGLSDAAADEFADQWVEANRQKDGTVSLYRFTVEGLKPYSDSDFAAVKAAGKWADTLNPNLHHRILADLNERLTAGENAPVIEDAQVLQIEASEHSAVVETGNGALDNDRALRLYVQQTLNKDGQIHFDKVDQILNLAKQQGVSVESVQTSENGRTAKIYLSEENKQQLDRFFQEAVGETKQGIQAGRDAAADTSNSIQEFYEIQANGAINVINDASKIVGAPALPKFEITGGWWQKNGRKEVGELTATVTSSVMSGNLGAAGKAINIADTAVSTTEAIVGEDVRTGEQLSTTQRIIQGVGAAASTPSAARDALSAAETAIKQTGKAVEKGAELADELARRMTAARLGGGGFGQPAVATASNAPTTAGKTTNRVPPQTAADLNSKIVTVDSNGNPSGLRFRDDYEAHMKQREFSKASQKEGVNGCHDMNELEQYDIAVNPTVTKDSIKILTKTPHPTVKGVYNIEYQMPKLNSQLNVIGWRYKSGTDPFVKTVYDPAIIPDEQMARWGREAFADAMNKNPALSGAPNIRWEGIASNGLKFKGFVDTKGSDAVRTFFPSF